MIEYYYRRAAEYFPHIGLALTVLAVILLILGFFKLRRFLLVEKPKIGYWFHFRTWFGILVFGVILFFIGKQVADAVHYHNVVALFRTPPFLLLCIAALFVNMFLFRKAYFKRAFRYLHLRDEWRNLRSNWPALHDKLNRLVAKASATEDVYALLPELHIDLPFYSYEEETFQEVGKQRGLPETSMDDFLFNVIDLILEQKDSDWLLAKGVDHQSFQPGKSKVLLVIEQLSNRVGNGELAIASVIVERRSRGCRVHVRSHLFPNPASLSPKDLVYTTGREMLGPMQTPGSVVRHTDATYYYKPIFRSETKAAGKLLFEEMESIVDEIVKAP